MKTRKSLNQKVEALKKVGTLTISKNIMSFDAFPEMESTLYFMRMEQETNNFVNFINSEIPLMDKFWFVCKKLATNEQNQLIAIGIAEIVLPIFEKKHPNDNRPRKAIQAAKDYLNGNISIGKLNLARNALNDVIANAYGTDSYYAAIAAAAAIDAAPYNNTAITADCAYDSVSGTFDIKYMDLLLSFLIDFCNK
jgi:hypothetical protein